MLTKTIKSIKRWFDTSDLQIEFEQERKGAEWVLFEYFINNQPLVELEEFVNMEIMLNDKTAFDHGVIRALRLIKEVETMREYYETRTQ